MKTFSTREIAQLKRTAQNVAPMVAKKNKIKNKMEELQAELELVQLQIDAWEGATKAMTGGYTTEDLIDRVVENTGKQDKDGKDIKVTKFVLKYPDTVVPPFDADCSVECCGVAYDEETVVSDVE